MIIALIGESGSGKTTLQHILQTKHKFKKIISYTTREKRAGEADGIDYNFISKKAFKKDRNEGKEMKREYIKEDGKYTIEQIRAVLQIYNILANGQAQNPNSLASALKIDIDTAMQKLKTEEKEIVRICEIENADMQTYLRLKNIAITPATIVQAYVFWTNTLFKLEKLINNERSDIYAKKSNTPRKKE